MDLKDIPLNDILLFISLVEEKSYSNAARKLDMDVSSLSKRIIRLEKNLKTQLLQRTTRQMNLTEAGNILYQHALHLKKGLQELEDDIHCLNMFPTGRLRIKSANSFGHAHLVNIIRDFLVLYPQVQFELILGGESTNLMREQIDILISIKPLDDVDLIAKKISERSTGIYGAPSYFQNHPIPQNPNDLIHHNCLFHLNRTDKNFWTFEINGQLKKIKINGNFSVNTNSALMSAALAGLGLAKLPSFMVQENVKNGRLIPVLTAFQPPATPIYAIYAKNRGLPKKIKVFLDFLTNFFAKLPD